MIKYIFIILFIPSIVFAEIENARDLMEEGKFKEAMEELLPAARSGNADAEELIGIMYAMGLGVERDDVRAFEWYLRSSMKGHLNLQSRGYDMLHMKYCGLLIKFCREIKVYQA